MKDIVYRIALITNPEIIVRAAQLESGLYRPEDHPETIEQSLYYSEWAPEDKTIEPDTPHKHKKYHCPVLLFEPCRMNQSYLVQLPNGMAKWVNGPINER